MLKYFKLIIIVSLLSVIGCKDKEPEEEQITADQGALLSNYADSLIIPSYTNFLSSIRALESNLESNASIADLQTNLDEAYLLWQSASFYDFGPALTYSLQNNINIYPSDTSLIDSNIVSEISDIVPSTFADQKGLPALDYLFYSNDDLTLQQSEYAKLIVHDMITKVSSTLDTWNSSYRDSFVANKGYDSGSSVSFLLNAFVQYFERDYRDGKLGFALGIRTSGEQLPDKAEGLFSDNSNEIFLASTSALKSSFYGNGGYGIDDLLNTDDSSLSSSELNRINALWTSIEQQVSLITTPIEVYVIDNQEDGNALYSDIQSLLVSLKINVLSSVNVKVSYVDNDGD